MHKLRKQGRHVIYNLSDRKDAAGRKLRKQSRQVVRNLTGRRDDATQKLREQSQQLIDRSGQLLEPVRQRGRKVWPIVGFILGFLLAAGITFWLVKRAFNRSAESDEGDIEISSREALNGVGMRPRAEFRYGVRGRTAVATKPETETEALNEFVGVLSTRQYYPLSQKPDAQDLVFFANEDDAKAEGFSAAL